MDLFTIIHESQVVDLTALSHKTLTGHWEPLDSVLSGHDMVAVVVSVVLSLSVVSLQLEPCRVKFLRGVRGDNQVPPCVECLGIEGV